ncbi:hypothetical protein Clacol_008784 [Clathrus columnatus]|uniref:Calcineurin-like phosphoesterase domain-containing protein n=1 Tax=Clathrus columnatus TaxID=1419009 RepID=A0AAV5AJG3_9AGAM|nr:hypothetical protein Clacol_008784 [Clathrus columnatus]
MDLQLISDLHLEMGENENTLYRYNLPQCAPDLALLGDIGCTKDPRLFEWLDLQLTRFKRVFFIMGHHEAYGLSLHDSIAAFEAFESKASSIHASDPSMGEFIFLNRKRYDVNPNLTILGCTLWSSLDPNYLDIFSEIVNDFRYIKDFGEEEYQAAHENDLSWLSNTIESIRQEGRGGRDVVVFTHHAPTFEGTSDPEYLGTFADSVYATELTELPLWGPPVTLWMHGHTHWCCDFERNAVRIISNPRGYYREITRFAEMT